MYLLGDLSKLQVIGLILTATFSVMFIIELYNYIYNWSVAPSSATLSTDDVNKWKYKMYTAVGFFLGFLLVGIIGFILTHSHIKIRNFFLGLIVAGIGFGLYLFKSVFEIALITQSDKTALIGSDTIQLAVLGGAAAVGWFLLIFKIDDPLHTGALI